MPGDIRVVVLSGVRHGADYLPVLLSTPGVEVLAVIDEADQEDPIFARSSQLARQHGVPFHGELTLLGDLAPDLVLVCSEPVRHLSHAQAALQLGIPVVIDKPCATSSSQLQRLMTCERDSGTWVSVVNRLGVSGATRMRDAVASGELGMPLAMDVEFLSSLAHFDTSVGPARLVVDVGLSGGGELLNFFGYAADLLVDVLGLPARAVTAMTGNNFSDLHAEHGVEDSAVINVEFERGVNALVCIARVSHTPTGTPTSSIAVLHGSHGHFRVSDEEPAVRVVNADGSQLQTSDIAQRAFREVWTEAVSCVRTGSRPRWKLQDSAAAMEIVFAAQRSASGQRREVISV